MILITGKGGAGSWKIRAEQLGKAMGAVVKANAPEDLVKRAEVVIVVKKIAPGYEKTLAKAKRVVWDVVDAWPQPAGNSWSLEEGVKFIRARAKQLHADQIVCATEQMRQDIGGDFTLYHHHWPQAERRKTRNAVRRVVYEGSDRYLGGYAKSLQSECERRGWIFAINDPLSQADIVIAARSGRWGGTLPKRWKSNVKLANAQGFGVPVVLNREAGYEETASGAELWADDVHEFVRAFDILESPEERIKRSRKMIEAAYPVEQAASDYLEWLNV